MSNSRNEVVIGRVQLRSDHVPTGGTQHTVEGVVVGQPAELRIVQFGGDPGFYLIHYDEDGDELTDTYHETKERAIEQARFEFGIEESDWC